MAQRSTGPKCVTIGRGGSSAELLDFGASLASVRVQVGGSQRNIVLSLKEFADYPSHGAFFGAIAGRCANRIRDGHLPVDGTAFQLTRNDNDRNHLHGGVDGFTRRTWTFASIGKTSAVLTLHSPDGEEGYPGNCDVTCAYGFESENVLAITLTAAVDAPTPVNLATHSYFNLGETPDILTHVLEIPADRITPIDESLIPTGQLMEVMESGFDFRTPSLIGEKRKNTVSGYDVNYAVYDTPATELRLMARLMSGERDLAMEIWSTEPGLQFYDGQYLPTGAAIAGGRHCRFAGLCLEPQRYPDAVHHSHFPDVLLRPGQTYRQRTEYRFEAR